MLTLTHLRCEYATDPIGIDVAHPRLSWIVQADGRDQWQSAYQILAATSRERLETQADLWDSGKILSHATIVPYNGRTLKSEEGCWWKVRVWDGDDRPSQYSQPAYFEMGLLSPQDWRADWIGFPGAWTGRALYFRRDFTVTKAVHRARIYMVGLGWSELRVNGERVNDRVLDPPNSNYAKRVFYSTDAVETFLRAGANTIGVICGAGWYGAVRLLLQMHIHYEDGDMVRIVSESYWPEPWKVFTGPVQENGVYDGEIYDARLEIPGWDSPDALPPAGLVAACADGPGGKLVAAALEPIRVVDSLSAQLIGEPQQGVYVFDLGQNIAGWVQLRVNGQRGDRVSLRFAETLHPDGSINQQNLRFARAEDIYILKGEGEEVWEPRFTYHGFRYVQVEGYPGQPTADSIVGRVVRSGVESCGAFECSNPLFNRIHQMVRWTEMSNLHSVPTDCPQRDERMGWLNDMAARSEEAIYNFGLARLLSKWMADIADEQDIDTGAITDTAPFRWGRRPADPVSICYLLIPWLLYIHYGDTYTLADRYDGMRRWVEYLTSRAEDDILSYSYYGDWAPPVHLGVSGSQGSSAVSKDTPGALISTACYAYSAWLLSQIAGVLNHSDDQARYAALAERIRRRYHQRFWNAACGGYGSNNQACNAISLYMNLAPEECIESVVAQLIANVERHDYHLTTGNICTKYLLEVLTAAGRADVAYAIAAQESYPSWGYMLANGATTLWERWEHATGSGMNSHNHPMLGSVGAWFFRTVAGIQADANGPGFARFDLHPHIDPHVVAARATLATVRGEIECNWQVKNRAFELVARVPVGSLARVFLPGRLGSPLLESCVAVWEDEQLVRSIQGIHSIHRQGDTLVCTIGSGTYQFQTTLPDEQHGWGTH